MKICSDTLVRHKKWKIFKKEIAEMFPIVAREYGLRDGKQIFGKIFFAELAGIHKRCLPICNSQNASKLSHFISRHSFPGQTNRTPFTMN